jgi:hypothetical protein
VQTVLNSQWNAAVIAKPSFDDLNARNGFNSNTVYIGVKEAKARYITTGSDPKDLIETPIFIYAVAETKSNCDKYLDEIRRIFLEYTTINGDWHVDSWEYKMVNEAKFYYDIVAKETLYDY